MKMVSKGNNSLLRVLVFLFDLVIIVLLTWYKFNFIWLDTKTQFIFSGDFVRPILADSAIHYYLYPYIFNEHTLSIDPTFALRIPYWGFVLFWSKFVSLNIVYWLLIICTHVLGGVLISYSSRNILYKKRNIDNIFLYFFLPLLPAIVYLYAYPTNYRPYWLFLPLLPPILFSLLCKIYEKIEIEGKKIKIDNIYVSDKIYLSILGYLSILQVHVFIFTFIALGTYLLIFLLIVQFKGLKNTFVFLRTLFSILFWYCLPSILLFTYFIIFAFFIKKGINPPYIYTLGVLEMMSKNANMINAFSFSVGFWEKVIFSDLDKILVLLLNAMLFYFLVKILSYNKETYLHILPLLLTYILFIHLELGGNSVLYQYLANPCFEMAFLFRDPLKMSYVALSLFIMLLLLVLKEMINNTLNNKNIIKVIEITSLLILIVIIIVVWNPPSKTSEILSPSEIPEEYFNLVKELNDGSSKPILFLPDSGKYYIWSNNRYLQASFLAMSYKGISLGASITQNPKLRELLKFSIQTKNVQILDFISSGIVIDKSLIPYDESTRKTVEYLLKNNSSIDWKFRLSHSYKYLVYFNNSLFSLFMAVPHYFVKVGSTDYIHLASIRYINPQVPVMFFDKDFKILSKGENSMVIIPTSSYGKPSKFWSRAMTSDPLHGKWHPYLKKFGIENWQSDYGYGLVFTWAKREIPKDIKPEDSDIIVSWDFGSEKEFEEWKAQTPEKQFKAIHEVKWKNGAIKTILWNSTWGWKVIKSPFIRVKSDHVYYFELRIKGENAHAVHVKILEFDKNKKYLTGSIVKNVGKGTFDWKEISFSYIPKDENTNYLQIQIWHGHETKQPLPNIVWVDDVKVYDITKYTKPVILEIPFEIKKSDNYKLFIRYFKNQKGGEIRVYLDEELMSIKTKDQLNKFVWEELGAFYLEKGKHKIILENVNGFNAVNLFVLIPEDEYYKAKKEAEELVKNKTIIYLFEAESDLYRSKAKIIKNINFSNGEALEFADKGKAWQDLEIIKSGTYRIALKGIGEFKVKIGNKTFVLNSNSNFTYSPLFYLEKGRYHLEIISLSSNTKLDVIWLYSTEANKTIEELFEVKEKPAEVISYEKINPTLWKVKVNATKPFMLSFAEAYDPLWEARVYKNGELIEKTRSLPLYSVINGFWINQTGDLEIVIRYVPQDWFEIGLIISAITFICCIAYLVYEWRKTIKN